VLGLSIVTPGGVIAAGQKLMDIVPEHRPLVTQVRISVDDVDNLRPGARALVRFPGLHDRSLPDLKGTLVRLSADSVADERAGVRYFTGEVAVPASEYERTRARHGAFALRAGMPVQVLFPLRARTALDYLLEPLTGGLWGALGEH
jgi:HlyD family secretion protein